MGHLPKPFVRSYRPIHAENCPWRFILVYFLPFDISSRIGRAWSRHVWHSRRRPRRSGSHSAVLFHSSLTLWYKCFSLCFNKFFSTFWEWKVLTCYFLFLKPKRARARYLKKISLYVLVLFCFKKYLLSSLSLGFGSSGRALLKKRTTLSHLYFAPGHWAALNSLSNGQQSRVQTSPVTIKPINYFSGIQNYQ